MSLINKVFRKFIDILNVNNWQIETDTGWSNITKIAKTVPYEEYEIKTKSYKLTCADEHIVFKNNMEEIFAKDLTLNDHIITENGSEQVCSIKKHNKKSNMYDIELDDENHRYYANGILSHNTTCYTIFCLWLATLFPEKKIMICANKLQTAIEILDRIRLAYEYITSWLKPGVIIYNKQEISFANKSTIRAFATSSSAARGFSANCVTGDTKVAIKDDFGTIFNCNIEDVQNIIQNQNDKLLFKVLTEDGWKKFSGIRISQTFELCKLYFSDGSILKCTKEHLIKLSDKSFKKACNLKINDIASNQLKLIDIEYITLKTPENVYDLIEIEDNHEYITNNVTSHNCCIIDEMAFIPKNVMSEFFASVIPIVSSDKNSKIIIVSTPNGTTNLYYDLWTQANAKDKNKNKQGWTPFRIDWWEVPGRDETWKQKQIATIGEKRFAQEYCNEFLSDITNKKLIPDDILEKYRMNITSYKNQGIMPKIQKIISQDQTELFEFFMWHEFQPQNAYLASADIAEGVGGDSSVLYVWDVTNLQNIKMCAKFSSNTVSVVQFAYIASKILAIYGNPYLAAERNGISGGFLDSLRITYGYQNIIKENKKNEPGIYSHVTVKDKACLWCREMLTTNGFNFTLYDKTLIDEFATFVKKETKGQHNVFQALKGIDSHDDHVLAFIWMTYILHNDLVQKYFIVCDTFVSDLNVQYPRILQPITSYTSELIKNIHNDQLYKDFIDFKAELTSKLDKAYSLLIKENQNDIYKYKNNIHDPYFDDDDGQTWNNSKMQNNLNNNYKMPKFYVF